MINRYTYAPINCTPHMEPMGAGEWVKWDDHASQLEAANQRHAAAIEAVATARADAMKEAAKIADVWYRNGGNGTPSENILAESNRKGAAE